MAFFVPLTYYFRFKDTKRGVFVPLKHPVDRGFALCFEEVVGLREMAATKEGTTSERRRMRRLKDMVTGMVDKRTLASRKIPPQQEDYTLTII